MLKKTEKRKKTKKKKIVCIIMIVIAALLLLLLAAGGLLLASYLSKVQYDNTDQTAETADVSQSGLTDEEILQELFAEESISDETDTAQDEIDALEQQMKEQLDNASGKGENSSGTGSDTEKADDLFNSLVIGCDSRKKGGVGRSDAMILFSVNEKTFLFFDSLSLMS